MTKGVYGGKQRKKAKRDKRHVVPETINQEDQSKSQGKDSAENGSNKSHKTTQ